MARQQPVEEEVAEQETVDSRYRRRIQLAEEQHGDECSEAHGPAPPPDTPSGQDELQ